MSNQKATSTEIESDSGISFLVAAYILAMLGIGATFAAVIVSIQQNIDFFLALIIIYGVIAGIFILGAWAVNKTWMDNFFITTRRWLGALEEDEETEENLHD